MTPLEEVKIHPLFFGRRRVRERFYNTQARSQFKERYGLVVRGGWRKIKGMVKEGRRCWCTGTEG
jgi:hypothetical protein